MANKRFKLTVKTKHIQLVADKILLLRLMKKLNGRFWGIYGLVMLQASIALCFYLQPELQEISTAFSDFGTTAKTAPYFTAGLFAAAYGLWRWRNYLSKSSKHPELITLSITAVIVGLYMVAFLPLNINDTVDSLHYLGFAIAGIGMVVTVLVDLLLRKTRKGRHKVWWQAIRVFCLLLIGAGITITMLSAERLTDTLELALLGEGMLLIGFSLWVMARTYQGEGVQTGFSRALSKVIIID